MRKGLLGLVALVVFTTFPIANAEARSRGANYGNATVSADAPSGHEEIAEAAHNKKRVHFLEVRDVVVTQLLPDDNKGLKHQKWMFKIESGEEFTAVYNSDMGEKIPLQVGDVHSVAGEFIWTNHGGLIHWLHADPKKKRPDGYVELNGERYGELGEGEHFMPSEDDSEDYGVVGF